MTCGSEIFFIVIPVLWSLFERIFWKSSLLSPWRWSFSLIGCFILSFYLNNQLASMMGGRWIWSEVLYYSWFLFSLFLIFQIVRKIIGDLFEKIPKSKVHLWLIKTLYYVVMFIIMVPFFLGMTSIHRIKISDKINPRNLLGLSFADVSLKTKDNLSLSAWFVPADSSKVVVIAHGLGANKSNFIGTVQMWHDLGWNVLIFDFRGHGQSDGHTVSFGYKERLDVIAAFDYLVKERKFRPEDILGYGVSFGAAAMLLAENETKLFKALIIDSSFADLDAMAASIVKGEKIIPPFFHRLIKEIGLFFVRLDLGFDIREHSPVNIVGKLSGNPILFIHGLGDPLIPWQHTQCLYEKANEPKQVVFLKTSGHFGTPNDPDYFRIIQNFLAKEFI